MISFLPVNTVLFVDVAGNDPPASFWRYISSSERDGKTSSDDSEQQHSQTGRCNVSPEPGPAPGWGCWCRCPWPARGCMVHMAVLKQQHVPMACGNPRATVETDR